MNRSRYARWALAAAAAAALPLGLTGTAHAATTSGLCTVTPLTPVFNNLWDAHARKMITYPVRVTCSAGRTVSITHERFEQDLVSREGEGGEDFLGTSTHFRDFTAAGGTVTFNVNASLIETDGTSDPWEEVYSKVRFTVSSNGVTSAPTAWEYSNVAWMYQ